MIQYLEYLKRIFFTTGTKYIGIILSELTLYQKVYLKYGNLKQNNPVYPKDKPKIWNTHCFPIPPANEHYFNLTWDIGYIYESLISDKIIEYMAAEEIKKFCEIDIKASEERSFKEIRKNIKPKYPHTHPGSTSQTLFSLPGPSLPCLLHSQYSVLASLFLAIFHHLMLNYSYIFLSLLFIFHKTYICLNFNI